MLPTSVDGSFGFSYSPTIQPETEVTSQSFFRNPILDRCDQTSGPRQSRLPFLLGSLAHNCRLRGDPYDPQRPGVLECGGCEGLSVAPFHSRSVRCDQLN